MLLSPSEKNLILRCATTFGGTGAEAPLRELARGVRDWPRLVRVARTHGVAPTLYLHLKDASSGDVPSDILESLGNLYRQNLLRNLFFTRELIRILDLFQSHGISAIPYKGPTLTALAYGDIGLRSFGDLDFIIRKADVQRARTLLASEGYSAERPLNETAEHFLLKQECEVGLWSPEKKVLVELHWDIVQTYYSYRFGAEDVWSNLSPVFLFGRKVMAPSAECLLLILSVHNGGKHQWETLSRITDMAQLIQACNGIDWDWVLDHGARARVERMLFLGLSLAEDLLGARVPPPVMERVKADPQVPRLREKIYDRLFADSGKVPGEKDRVLLALRSRRRWADRMTYGFRRLFTSTEKDWSLITLPPWLHPMYRILRPARLAMEVCKRVFPSTNGPCLRG